MSESTPTTTKSKAATKAVTEATPEAEAPEVEVIEVEVRAEMEGATYVLTPAEVKRLDEAVKMRLDEDGRTAAGDWRIVKTVENIGIEVTQTLAVPVSKV